MSDSKISKCPVCSESRTLKAAVKNYYLEGLNIGIKQEYRSCSRCGLLFVLNPPSGKFLSQYYNTSLQERRSSVDFSERRHISDQVKFFKKAIASWPQSVLEVGPNHGVFLNELKKKGARKIYYSELNERSARLLKAKGYMNFDARRFKNITVELIAIFHTLEHIVDPRRFIKNLVSRLSEGGHIYIEVPDFSLYDEATDSLLFEHVNYFNKLSLHYLLAECSLELVAVESDIDPLYAASPRRIMRMITRKSQAVPKNSRERVHKIRERVKRDNLFFEKLDRFLSKVKPEEPLGIYTAGLLARESLRKTDLKNKTLVGIFDRDLNKRGKKIEGILVLSSAELAKYNLKHLLVLNEGYESEIRKILPKKHLAKATFYSDIMKL